MSTYSQITGSFNAVGNDANTLTVLGPWQLVLTGTFSGTVTIEMSPNSGASWVPLCFDGTTTPITADAAGCVTGRQRLATLMRVACTAFTSGSIDYALGNVFNA